MSESVPIYTTFYKNVIKVSKRKEIVYTIYQGPTHQLCKSLNVCTSSESTGATLMMTKKMNSIFHQKLRLCWLSNAREQEQTTWNLYAQRKPNLCIPNANCIPPAGVGTRVGHYRLALGIIGTCWALLAQLRGRVGVREDF